KLAGDGGDAARYATRVRRGVPTLWRGSAPRRRHHRGRRQVAEGERTEGRLRRLDAQGALPHRGQEDDGVRALRAARRIARRDRVSDRRRHRSGRDVEGVRRNAIDGLDPQEAAAHLRPGRRMRARGEGLPGGSAGDRAVAGCAHRGLRLARPVADRRVPLLARFARDERYGGGGSGSRDRLRRRRIVAALGRRRLPRRRSGLVGAAVAEEQQLPRGHRSSGRLQHRNGPQIPVKPGAQGIAALRKETGERLFSSMEWSSAATSSGDNRRFGMRTLRYLAKRSTAMGSFSSSSRSGSETYWTSQARSRRAVTPARSGPTAGPLPTLWQAEQRLRNRYPPLPTSGIAGASA